MEDEFQDLVKRVRADYFSRWRRASRWTVRREKAPSDLSTGGSLCHAETRTIWINPSDPSPETLIHEMCHAVTPGGHGKKWQERLLLAARDAESKHGDRALAKELREEVQKYVDTPTITARLVYGWIEDAIYDGAEVDGAIDWAARQCEMTREQFLSKYKRAVRVAESAFRERQTGARQIGRRGDLPCAPTSPPLGASPARRCCHRRSATDSRSTADCS